MPQQKRPNMGHAPAMTRLPCSSAKAARRPAAWAGRWRPSGRLGLAARPDQRVRAVLFLDQPGIDRCWERRIVEGHGHVGPFGLADFLPRRADVEADRKSVV